MNKIFTLLALALILLLVVFSLHGRLKMGSELQKCLVLQESPKNLIIGVITQVTDTLVCCCTPDESRVCFCDGKLAYI